MQQTNMIFEPKKSIMRGKFFYQTEMLFPTYILVVQEAPRDPSQPQVVLNGELVQYRNLSKEQRAKPLYQIFSMDDDKCISGYHTFDRDIQKFVDWFNITEECDWINPEYVPKVKTTTNDVRFAHRDQVHKYYAMKDYTFLSAWKRGMKSFAELDEKALELTPKYNVKQWSTLANQHKAFEITIVTDSSNTYAIQNGKVITSECSKKLTTPELESRLKIKAPLSLAQYIETFDSYTAIGIAPNEQALHSYGVKLSKKQMLPLLQLEGNKVSLPQDVRFSDDCYRELKKAFVNASGKYSASGFVFDQTSEAIDTFNRLLDGEDINIKKSLQYYPTTEAASKNFLDGVDFTGLTVFEPGAGEGFLVKKAFGLGAKEVLASEIYSKFHPALTESGATIIADDLFTVTKEDLLNVDAVLMNPPFTGGLDVKHINYVLSIIPDHVPVYSIMSKAVENNPNKIYSEFRAYLKSIGVETKKIEKCAFKDSGTNISSVYVHIPMKRTKQLVAA